MKHLIILVSVILFVCGCEERAVEVDETFVQEEPSQVQPKGTIETH